MKCGRVLPRDHTRSATQAESSSRRPRVVQPPPGGHTPAVACPESHPRPAPRSRGGHGLQPVTALRNPPKPRPTPYSGWVRPLQRSLGRRAQPPSLETCRSQRKHLRVLDANAYADQTPRPRHPTRQQVSPAVVIAKDVHDRKNTRLRLHSLCTRLTPRGHRPHVRKRVAQQRPTEYIDGRAKTASNDIAQHLGTFPP